MTEQQTHHDETIPPDLQATADLLRDALAAEPVPAAAQTPATAKRPKLPIQFARFALPAAVAAAILLMFGFVFGTLYTNQQQPVVTQNIEPTSDSELRDQLAFERATAQTLAEQIRKTSIVQTKTPAGTLRDEDGAKLAQTPTEPVGLVRKVKRLDDVAVSELDAVTTYGYTPSKKDIGAKQLARTARSLNKEIERRNADITAATARIDRHRTAVNEQLQLNLSGRKKLAPKSKPSSQVGYNQDEIFRQARSRDGKLRVGGGSYGELTQIAGIRLKGKAETDYSWESRTYTYKDAIDRTIQAAERPATDRRSREGWNREGYDSLPENDFLASLENPLSTFSIDVDTASYANMRRFLNRGQLPPAGSIRIEELVNYFNYQYAPPAKGDDHPFAAHLAVADCPWAPNHRLVRVALKGKEIADADRPASNLVFLLDVSGSMNNSKKLPLVKKAMTMLAQRLDERDKVSIVVYAGAAGVVLPSTCASDRNAILGALAKLNAGGSTAGGAGIKLAYKIAAENYIKGGTNRVILCTDGDFNVGTTSEAGLEKLITEKAKSGVFLTVLGFGMGNYQDGRLEKLADKGNGTYGYIDNEKEARKHFVEGLTGTLVTIDKDVKIQVEFNPAEVAAYRLIGYENRMLAKEDFNDDTKDAGEIGAGHTVTALYEIVPAGSVRNVANRIARLKERAAAMQKQIAEWTSQLPKLSDEKRNEQVQVIAAMVQQRGDLLAGIKAMETMQAKQAKATPVKTGTVDPLKYITPTALSKEAKTGEMLTLKLRYKQPEGEKSILMQQSLTDKGVRFAQADREFQVAAMVAQFGMQLRGSKHAGNYSLPGVAETLAPLVKQYDPHKHRVELLRLVQKAATLKK